MKTYNQMSEDIESRRAELASRQRDRAASFKQRSRDEMDRRRGSSSSGSSGESGGFVKSLGRAVNKDISRAAKAVVDAPGKAVRGAIERRKKAKAEKEAAAKSKAAADKKNEVNRAPFKPKRASKGVPFQPKKSDA